MSADSRIVIRPSELQGGPVGVPGLVIDSEDRENSNPPRIINDGQELQVRAQRADLASALASNETAQLQVMLRPRIAISANVVTRAGLSTIQGVSLEGGDLIVLWGQTDPTENGPYVIHANIAGVVKAWTRPALPFGHGSQVYVIAGTYAGQILQNTNASKIIYGTSQITFNRTATSGGGGGGVTQVSADYQVLPSDSVIYVDSTAAVAVTLEASAGIAAGREVEVVRLAAAPVTVKGSGSDVINGNTDTTLTTLYQRKTFKWVAAFGAVSAGWVS